MKLIDELRNIKLAIFDLDGVVYRGQKIVPGSNQVIKQLKEMSVDVVYNSNNSTITREMYVERLKHFGIDTNISDFYTSASITAAEITKLKENSKIYVIGEIGIKEELRALGHTIIKKVENPDKVDFVIVGLDTRFKYKKIAEAQKCILRGHARFYATNPDTTLPMADGLWPGAGVMVNAVETCTAQPPIKIFGKPQPDGIELILEDHNVNAKEACIFGDRTDTDILAGNRAGVITVAVLTGVTTKEMIKNLQEQSELDDSFDKDLLPDVVIDQLNSIFSE